MTIKKIKISIRTSCIQKLFFIKYIVLRNEPECERISLKTEEHPNEQSNHRHN